MLREAAFLLLRENQRVVREHIELAVSAGLDLGLLLGLLVQLGRETRGPFVVAVSDGAVEDAYLRHDENLPTPREPQRIAAGAGLRPAGGLLRRGGPGANGATSRLLVRSNAANNLKEGAHGGTRGSPVPVRWS